MTIDYVACGSLIVDDIVFSNGKTYMNTIGGAGTHALFGMRVWSDRVGFVSSVGGDFDPEHRKQLQDIGIDLRGMVIQPDAPTARAWQLMEDDDRRVEVFRTDPQDLDRLEPPLESFPEDYRMAKGMHLHRGELTNVVELIRELRESNPNIRLGWEPAPHHLEASADHVREILPGVDFFSPCMIEGIAITKESVPEAIVEKLLEWGAPIVALRIGAKGSLVVTATGEHYDVPAVPANVVDTTGAGNAYCGGFLVGLHLTDNAGEAAAFAAVSGSVAVEQVGIPRFDEQTRLRAKKRLGWTREQLALDPATYS